MGRASDEHGRIRLPGVGSPVCRIHRATRLAGGEKITVQSGFGEFLAGIRHLNEKGVTFAPYEKYDGIVIRFFS